MFWKNKIVDCAGKGKPLGFKMHAVSNMEKYRADTFYTKEPETLVWIDGFKPNSIMLDIGANIGVYSLYCAKTKPTIHVYAFEPLRENFTRLVDNITLNGLSNITPFNEAMGKCSMLAKFFVKSSGVGDSGSQLHAPIDENGEKIKAECERQVLTTSFDRFVEMIPNKRPIYLKIDVDGHEMDVLEGISFHAPSLEGVLIEVNAHKTPISTVTGIMKRWGLVPDARINHVKPHSSERRGGNPVNIVFTRPY